MISPIISSFETTTVMPSSSSSSMNSLNIENERKQQQQKSSTTMTNTVVSGEKSNEIEIMENWPNDYELYLPQFWFTTHAEMDESITYQLYFLSNILPLILFNAFNNELTVDDRN